MNKTNGVAYLEYDYDTHGRRTNKKNFDKDGREIKN
jgi:hypothetical protein